MFTKAEHGVGRPTYKSNNHYEAPEPGALSALARTGASAVVGDLIGVSLHAVRWIHVRPGVTRSSAFYAFYAFSFRSGALWSAETNRARCLMHPPALSSRVRSFCVIYPCRHTHPSMQGR